MLCDIPVMGPKHSWGLGVFFGRRTPKSTEALCIVKKGEQPMRSSRQLLLWP